MNGGDSPNTKYFLFTSLILILKFFFEKFTFFLKFEENTWLRKSLYCLIRLIYLVCLETNSSSKHALEISGHVLINLRSCTVMYTLLLMGLTSSIPIHNWFILFIFRFLKIYILHKANPVVPINYKL